MASLGGGLYLEEGHWEHALAPFSLCFSDPMEMSSFVPPHPSAVMLCLTTGPETMEP